MEQENKPTRGGARPGAGRKKTNGRSLTLTVRVTPDALAIVAQAPNRSEYVDTAIKFYHQNKKDNEMVH